ncbi:MAG: CCA tRNA nucleotidyltransferase [Thermoplasmata archaeon]|nr:CCA tRNA nucleotidyltransferase [Thermoplasmata archaeon]
MGRPPRDAPPEADASELEARVRREIAPRPETLRRLATVREDLVARAQAEAKQLGIPLRRALVAGSAARETFLEDRVDVDLFLLFSPEHSREALERDGLALAGRLVESPEVRYAEHPYLRGKSGGFNVDAVPGYDVSDPSHPLSAVDRTPFHQAYLLARETPVLVDEVRLTKRFLRSIGVYGSEAKTQGLSGYLVELLVLKFGGFRPLLRAVRDWRPPVRVHFTAGSEPRVPPGLPLIVDDPVDPHRNVASALSIRNLALFQLAAQEYLARPSEAFFTLVPTRTLPPEEALTRVKERGTHVSGLALPRPRLVDDIVYPQLYKAERAIAEESERLGFRPMGTASAAGEETVVLLLEVEQGELPAVRAQRGPPVGLDRVGSFLEKWEAPAAPVLQGPYVRPDGSMGVETRRALREVEALLTDALPRLPLGKDLVRELRPEHRFLTLRALAATPELSLALGELLEKRLPWRSR